MTTASTTRERLRRTLGRVQRLTGWATRTSPDGTEAREARAGIPDILDLPAWMAVSSCALDSMDDLLPLAMTAAQEECFWVLASEYPGTMRELSETVKELA